MDNTKSITYSMVGVPFLYLYDIGCPQRITSAKWTAYVLLLPNHAILLWDSTCLSLLLMIIHSVLIKKILD